ncbi:MAG: hypothetical protein VCA55_04880 [Verrucomicrobiales bacterium]
MKRTVLDGARMKLSPGRANDESVGTVSNLNRSGRDSSAFFVELACGGGLYGL